MMTGYIYIRNLRFHSYHGVLEQERLVGNDYMVSLRVEIPVETVIKTDHVEDTVSYADIFDKVKQEMEVCSALLEHVAYRIGQRLFNEFPLIKSVDVNVMKLNPPMGADCDGAGVELHLINDKTS